MDFVDALLSFALLAGAFFVLCIWFEKEKEGKRLRELEMEEKIQRLKSEQEKFLLERVREIEKKSEDLITAEKELLKKEKELVAENARSIIEAEKAKQNNDMVRLGVGFNLNERGLHGNAQLEMSNEFAMAAAQALPIMLGLGLPMRGRLM